VPNLLIMAPADENECRQMLTTGYQHNGPSAVRYPRGTGPGIEIETALTPIDIAKAEVKREGTTVAILAFGSMVQAAIEAGETLDATVVNMRFIKPLDTDMLDTITARHELIITIEENTVLGGAGSGIAEYLLSTGSTTAIKLLGLPDNFLDHGVHQQMLADCGLSAEGIINTVKQHFPA